MLYTPDTIAAICTPPGEGAIAVVRVSGPQALAIADRVFRCAAPAPSQRASHTFVYGRVAPPAATPADGAVLDEAILLLYRAPRSYTREDIVEFQGHGGATTARRVLRAVLDAGARPAAPGEFTQRAFLNGRLDLTQAEAVLDLIRAQSDRAADMALLQLSGSITCLITNIYDILTTSCADLEATLDFSEEELPLALQPNVRARLEEALRATDALLATWEEGHRLREGALLVIAGRPNAGKSSLLNRLLGRDRAIVSPQPGTTRDTIEETWIVEGIPVRLTDTAGLRPTDCPVEQAGIARTDAQLQQADIIVYVVDAAAGLDAEDLQALARFQGRNVILLCNKTDLPLPADALPPPAGIPVVSCSLTRDGAPAALLRHVAELLQTRPQGIPHAAISQRHCQHLLAARRLIDETMQLLAQADPAVAAPAASLLRDAMEEVGRITGRDVHADVLGAVFSRFCIGK